MKFNKYLMIVFTFVSCIILLDVAHAYFMNRITGIINATTNDWSFAVNINNATLIDDYRSLTLASNTITPGSSGSFVINIDGTGSMMGIEYNILINGSTIPTNMDFCLDSACATIISKANGIDRTISYNASMAEDVTIYWKWTANKYANDDGNFTSIPVANIFVKARRYDEPMPMKNGSTYSTEFWQADYKPYIRTIEFSRDTSGVPNTCDLVNLCFDVSLSSSQEFPVYAYFTESEYTNTNASYILGKKLYDLHIACLRKIEAPSNCTTFFSMNNLVQVNFNGNFDTSKVTNMRSLFSYSTNLTTFDSTGLNTGNVTDMSGMFLSCSSLVNLNLSGFNTSKVTDMSHMFERCSSLVSLDLSSFNTSKVTNMCIMFSNCSNLTNLDISSFDFLSVTGVTGTDSGFEMMFYNCSKLTTTINMNGYRVVEYTMMFDGTATNSSALVTVNYTSMTNGLVNNMIATKSDYSNVVKGTLIS